MSARVLSRFLTILIALALFTGLPSPVQAVCPGGPPIILGLTSSFQSCGPNAAAFFWAHGRGVQRVIASDFNFNRTSIAGHDCGRNQVLADGVMSEGPNGAANGSYFGNSDWMNLGTDGCVTNLGLED